MTHLGLVPPGAPAPGATSARLALSEHLGHIAAAQRRFDALRRVWDQMQAGKSAEARCRSVLETQIRCEEEAMQAWTRDPGTSMPRADVYAREMNEAALANAKRIADTIRAAEPEHTARQTQALLELEAAKRQLPSMTHAVLMEEAAALREQLNATMELANAQSAQLFGLRAFLDAQGAIETAQAVPVTHEMWPAQAAIKIAHQFWQAYATRLATNPNATLEDD